MSDIPEVEPAWFKSFRTELTSIGTNVYEIRAEIEKIRLEINDVSCTASEALKSADEAKTIANSTKEEVGELRLDHNELKTIVNDLQEKVIDLECRERRNNLIFVGINEDVNESLKDTETKILTLLEDGGISNVVIEKIFRVGFKTIEKPNQGSQVQQQKTRPRNVIVQFATNKDRNRVWTAKTKLSKDLGIWIMEDFPEIIRKRRRILQFTLKAARQSGMYRNVSLKLDKLVLDNRQYSVNTLKFLPKDLQPENTAISETEDTVVFLTHNAIFSNLHPTPVVIDGREYKCNEQYLQYTKATVFNDQTTAKKILNETDPYNIMNLAKEIKGYHHTTWMKQVKEVLTNANTFKYEQNQVAREALLATNGKWIGEASTGALYGTGIGFLSDDANTYAKWTGNNMMGKILMDIRRRYRPDPQANAQYSKSPSEIEILAGSSASSTENSPT